MKVGLLATLSLSVWMLCGTAAFSQIEPTGTGGGTVGIIGKVKKFDPDSSVIELDKGGKYRLDKDTEITRRGKHLNLSDIKIGHNVTVTAKKSKDSNDAPHAFRIEIH
jgi:hypothetical protein